MKAMQTYRGSLNGLALGLEATLDCSPCKPSCSPSSRLGDRALPMFPVGVVGAELHTLSFWTLGLGLWASVMSSTAVLGFFLAGSEFSFSGMAFNLASASLRMASCIFLFNGVYQGE